MVEAATIPVKIGLIGKYIELPDAYLSVVESLKHAGFHHGAKVEIDWIQAEDVEGLLAAGRLDDLDGIVDPRRVRRSAASRARSPPPATPARKASRASGSASACRR